MDSPGGRTGEHLLESGVMVDPAEERVRRVGADYRLGVRRLESRRRECRFGTGRIPNDSAGARGRLSR